MKWAIAVSFALFCISLAASASTVTFATFLGGSDIDTTIAVATDLDGNTIVVGDTVSISILGLSRPTTAFSDTYVVKLNRNGVVVFRKFLGGSGSEIARAVTTDSSGNIYVAGVTSSFDFPLKNPFRSTLNTGGDLYLVKMTGSGEVIYSTFFGGTGVEQVGGVAADASGNAYVTGYTNSADLPLVREAQRFPPGSSAAAFLFKINSNGSALGYSTYLGGALQDLTTGVKVDRQGNAYVAGTTRSLNFPTTANAFQRNRRGDADAFVTKYDSSGAVVFSTLIGGQEQDAVTALDVKDGGIYVAGVTSSSDFPTRLPLIATRGAAPLSALAAKFTTEGTLVFSTYLNSGGSAQTQAVGIGVNGQGEAAVLLGATANDLPTKNAVQPSLAGQSDAYIVQLNTAGSERVFATYFGGGAIDVPTAMSVDAAGRITFCGNTSGTLLTKNAALAFYQGGLGDGFVTRIQLEKTKSRVVRH